MNYQSNILKTFTLDLDPFSSGYGAYALFESGSAFFIEMPSSQSWHYDDITYYYVNYAQRQYPQDTPVMYLASTPDNLTLAVSTKVDYVVSRASGGEVLSANGISPQGTYYDLGDGSILNNYPQYNPNDIVSGYTYGAFNVAFDDDYAIYDFSSVQGKTISNFKADSLYLRGENISYYNSWLSFYNITGNSLEISYGAPYYNYGNSEYERGYTIGYSGGFVDGFDGGYTDGLRDGGISTESATAFSYLGSAFNAVGGIMSLEILPNITLGLVWTIPMVFVLIMTIFKLVRK